MQHSEIPTLIIPLCVSLQFSQSSCKSLRSLLSLFHFVSVYSSSSLCVAFSDPCSHHSTLCQFTLLPIFVQNSHISALTIPLCISLQFSLSLCSTLSSLLVQFHFVSVFTSRNLRVALSDPCSYYSTLCQFTVLVVFVQHSHIPTLTIPLCVSLPFSQSSCSTLRSLLIPFHFVSVYSSRSLRVAIKDPCSYYSTLCQFKLLSVFVQNSHSPAFTIPLHQFTVLAVFVQHYQIPALTIPHCASLQFSLSSCSTLRSLLLLFHFVSVYRSRSLRVALSDLCSYYSTLCQFTVLAVFVQHSQISALTIPLCASLQFSLSLCSTLGSLLLLFHFVSVYCSRSLRVKLSNPCSHHSTLCQFTVLEVFMQHSQIRAYTIPLCVSLQFSQPSCKTLRSLLSSLHFVSVYSSSSLCVALSDFCSHHSTLCQFTVLAVFVQHFHISALTIPLCISLQFSQSSCSTLRSLFILFHFV